MANNLKDKVAVVTGSGQGIGRAIALAMAREGASIVTNNRKPGSTSAFVFGEAFEKSIKKEYREWILERNAEFKGDAETTAKEIESMGGKSVPFFGDVANFDVAGKLIETAIQSFGKIDILVNNHSTFRDGPIWEMTEEQWDYVTVPKIKGYFNTIRHATPLMMKQRWGRIINCTSGAWLGAPDKSNYSAANAGVIGLSRAIARELYPYGITCNIYAPSALTRATATLYIHAKIMAEAGTPVMPKGWTEMLGTQPNAEGLAPFVAYLATDQAADISGTVFAVRSSGLNGPEMSIYSEPEIKRTLAKGDIWTVDELIEKVPEILLAGYKNPASAA